MYLTVCVSIVVIVAGFIGSSVHVAWCSFLFRGYCSYRTLPHGVNTLHADNLNI